MAEPSLQTKIQRLTELTADYSPLSRDLLHAYASCIGPGEVFDAVELTIEAATAVRRAVTNRLIRVCKEEPRPADLAQLVARLIALKRERRALVVRVNSIFARLIEHLDLQLQRRVIESWRSDERKDSSARWIKAAAERPELLDLVEVLNYWQATGDTEAAKLIAYKAPAELVADALPDLVEMCDEGWIIGRAALGAARVLPETLQAIRAKFPATYAYVCAMTGRALSRR